MTSRYLAAQHETVLDGYKISSSNLRAHITGMRTDLTLIVRDALQGALAGPNESARSCLLIGEPGSLPLDDDGVGFQANLTMVERRESKCTNGMAVHMGASGTCSLGSIERPVTNNTDVRHDV